MWQHPFRLLPVAIFFMLTVSTCRKQTPFQKGLVDLKSEIKILEEKNNRLEEQFDTMKKSRSGAIERKINANLRKIRRLNHELSRLSKDTQKRVLKSISETARKKNRGN